MRKTVRNSFYLLLASCFLVACEESVRYHSYQAIARDGWKKSDTLHFEVPLADTLNTLRLWAEVRNENNYPYRNLYLLVGQNIEESTIWTTDTVEITLANEEGKWLGTGWGSLFQSALPIRSVRCPHRGTYTIKVWHGMKESSLPGLSDVGIKIGQ